MCIINSLNHLIPVTKFQLLTYCGQKSCPAPPHHHHFPLLRGQPGQWKGLGAYAFLGLSPGPQCWVGGGGRRMTQAGPQGGVRRFLHWQVQAEGSGDRAGSCCRGGTDGAIKTQRHGLIVQNCVRPTKQMCCSLWPWRGSGGGKHRPPTVPKEFAVVLSENGGWSPSWEVHVHGG